VLTYVVLRRRQRGGVQFYDFAITVRCYAD
jgi:hypothetical protein